MKKYIMSIDQGTTSSRAIIFDSSGKMINTQQKEFTQIYSNNGWVEHNAMEIYNTQLEVCRKAIENAGLTAGDIACIGITNQRETTVVWDKTTGAPICNAIVWQCRRTADFCHELKNKGLTKFFADKTGLFIDPYFSATKLRWILDNIPHAREKAENNQLLFGTIDCWLIWKLSGGKVHKTDYSNASRTMLFNIQTLEWDDEILGLLGIPKSLLPEVVESSGKIAYTDEEVFNQKILISGCAGDQQAALFGQCCFAEGDVKNTYGTGGFLLMNTGCSPIKSQNGLISTIAWGIDGKVTYALEGSVFISGAIVKWLRDSLGVISSAAETENIALSVSDSNGVYTVPAFVGMGAPYWDSQARGAILGLTRGADFRHIVRSALEAIAYQTYDVLEVMEKDTSRLNCIKADGGASANNFLMQFQADILGRQIIRPHVVESTALGACYLAGLGCGIFKSISQLTNLSNSFEEFTPSMDESTRNKLLSGWRKSVSQILTK